MMKIFRLRREERWIALSVMVLLVALNALTICKYYGVFSPLSTNYWNLFVGKFHVSGFDPISYYVVSDWEARYNVYRHPLLSFIMWLPYVANRVCMALLGINCAQFIVALMLVFAGFYSFIFMHRICRDVLSLGRTDSGLLSFFLFSFAFIMLSAMVPDHFILSLFLLLLTLYVSGVMLKKGKPMSRWQTIALFMATAGVSLNNGLKVFTASFFVNGKRFLRPIWLLSAVVLPAWLMWMGARMEYKYQVAPNERVRHEARARRKAQQKKALESAPKPKSRVQKPAVRRGTKQGKPLMQGEFMRWTDVTTPRWPSVVENLFGESIQLHPDYLLQDEFRYRPVIVKYRWIFNYIAESLVVFLFLAGIWLGRKNRFLWLCMSWFAFDMLLHMGLGFGINEVYIMSAHWIFVLPVAAGYVLKACCGKAKSAVRTLLFAITAYLYLYNGYFILQYMTC